MNVNEALRFSRDNAFEFSKTPALDAEVLLSYVLQVTKEQLFIHPERALEADEERKLHALLAKRIKGMPISYLVCEKEFFGRSFYVDERVLIPKPETETLVETALSFLGSFHVPERKIVRIVDIGTGSGCIIVTLARELMNRGFDLNSYSFVGVDNFPKALEVAKQNIEAFDLTQRITLTKSYLLDNVSDVENCVDIVIANLPYVGKDDTISAETHFEPSSALYAEDRGLSLYKELVDQMLGRNIAAFFFEVAPWQVRDLKNYIEEAFTQVDVKVSKDLSGKERVVSGVIM